MKKSCKKILSLVLVALLSISNLGSITSLGMTKSTNIKNFNVTSSQIPDNVQAYVAQKFKSILLVMKQAANTMNINPSEIDSYYLGKGFNIFNYANNSISTVPIYYFPIMYNSEIRLIITASLNDDGGISLTLGKDFAQELQNVINTSQNATSSIIVKDNDKFILQSGSNKFKIADYSTNTQNIQPQATVDYVSILNKSNLNSQQTNIMETTEVSKAIVSPISQAIQSTLPDNDSYQILGYPLIYQSTTSWCGFSTMASIVDYYTRPATLLQAKDVAKTCGVTDTRIGINIIDACTDLQNLFNLNCVRYTSHLTYDEFSPELKLNHPLYLGWTGRDSVTQVINSHATALVGYFINQSLGYNCIFIMNPAYPGSDSIQAVFASANGLYSFTMDNTTYGWTGSIVTSPK